SRVLIKPLGEDFIGTVKPLRVSLVEPVAYPKPSYPPLRAARWHTPKGAPARPGDRCGACGECAARRPAACPPLRFCFPSGCRKTGRAAGSAGQPKPPPPPSLLVDIASSAAPYRGLLARSLPSRIGSGYTLSIVRRDRPN